MPLTIQQVDSLQRSITDYAFPPVCYDFATNRQMDAGSMVEVEKYIRSLLASSSIQDVEHGLANVVYWGNANAGYQMHRVDKFRSGVTETQLREFQRLVSDERVLTLTDVARLKMPQYSGVSFVSKVVAFLDPVNHCVLDLLLSRLNGVVHGKALQSLKVSTQIGVTKGNSQVYYAWCKECVDISGRYFDGAYRAVDVERGFFNMIRGGHLKSAQEIYADA